MVEGIPKTHIVFDFTDSPHGGGNQMLKALRNDFRKIGCYAEYPKEAELFLFNNFQAIDQVAAIKKQFPSSIFVHRIAGPIRLCTNMRDYREYVVINAARAIADALVFQSTWSRNANRELGFPTAPFEAVISNAPDPLIFNKAERMDHTFNGRKIRLVAMSWSPNWRKGFATYKWLDENLDFTRYEMTFIGNSPITFNNIVHLPPMPSLSLSQALKQHDIFIFASEVEACSNALLEALHCGLPSIAPNSTSNPDVLGKGGLLYNDPGEIPMLLEKIVDQYEIFVDSMPQHSLERVAGAYVDFFLKIAQQTRTGLYRPKRFTFFSQINLSYTLVRWRMGERIRGRMFRARSH